MDLLHELPKNFEELIREIETHPQKDGDLDRHDILEWAKEADAFLGYEESLENVSVSGLAEWLGDMYEKLDDDDAMERLREALVEAGAGEP